MFESKFVIDIQSLGFISIYSSFLAVIFCLRLAGDVLKLVV